MNQKDKLIELLGEDYLQELPIESLVEYVIAKCENLEATIEKLKGANGAEHQRLRDETDAMRRERESIRCNPQKVFWTDKHFIGAFGNAFKVFVKGDLVTVHEVIDTTEYVAHEVSYPVFMEHVYGD